MSEIREPRQPVDPIPAVRRRRSRSRSLRRSFGKWSRACWPFLFVAGAALLSAGVVQVVETAPQSVSRADLVAPDMPTFSPVENLLDVEFFDQHFYWDQGRIERARRIQEAEITLSADPLGRVALIVSDSFLDDPVRVPIDPAELPFPVDDPEFEAAARMALPSVEEGPPSSAPDPATVWPLGIGLCLLATRAAIASIRTPRSTRLRS